MLIKFSDFDYKESDLSDYSSSSSDECECIQEKDEAVKPHTSINPIQKKLNDHVFNKKLDPEIIERINIVNLNKDERHERILEKFIHDHIDNHAPRTTLGSLLYTLNDNFTKKVKKFEEEELQRGKIVVDSATKFYDSCIIDFSESTEVRKQERKKAQYIVIQKLKSERDQKLLQEKKRLAELERKKKEEEEKERLRKSEKERKRKQAAEEEAKKLQLQKQKEEQERQKAQAEEHAEAARKAQMEKDVKLKLEQEQQKKEFQEKAANRIKEQQVGSNVEAKLDRYIDVCSEFRKNVKLVMLNDPNLASIKKQCNALRRKINPKFGQLINSYSKVNTITLEIINFVEQSKQLGSNNAELSHFIHKWFMYTLTKLIIKQAEKEIRVSIKAAMPLAYVVVYLLIKYPELKEILLAKFIKKCPYILGYSASFSTIQGRTKMGWKFTNKESQIFESDLEYNERVGGIFTLWSMITTVQLKNNLAIFNSLGNLPTHGGNVILQPIMISKSWIMISRLMNIDKRLITNSHFFMLCNWFQIAGQAFVNAYGKQGKKLIHLVCFEYTKDFTGKEYTYSSKLSSLGEEWEKLGKFNDLEPMTN